MARSPLDLVFVVGNNDEARLWPLLESSNTLTRVVFALSGREPTQAMVAKCEAAGLLVDRVQGESEAQATSRAMLSCGHDVLLIGGRSTPSIGAAEALDAALVTHDRAVASFPSSVTAPATPSESAGLPVALPAVVPDSEVVLFRGWALKMVGGLDAMANSTAEAICDWALRAQRLGLIVVRATKATIVDQDGEAAAGLPWSDWLGARHPYYRLQRRLAESDPALTVARGARAASSRPEVCLDLRYLPKGAINGTGVYAIELARALLQTGEVTLSACVEDGTQQEAIEGLKLGIAVTQNAFSASAHLVHRPAQVFRPDHLRLLVDGVLPNVITFQDLIGWRAGSAHAGAEEQLRYQFVSSLAVRSAQRIIAISEHNRREIVRDLGVPEDRVITVHHGVHAGTFAARDVELNRRLLSEARVPSRFFLFVGSDYAHKNVRLLTAAFAEFRAQWRDSGPAPVLVMVGHGSGTIDGLYRLLAEKPMPGVIRLDNIGDPLLRALYQESIALLYPSAYEGFGMPILEGFAAGTPVVCTAMSAMPEVAGEASLTLDQGSPNELCTAMKELVSNAPLRARLIERGRRQVEGFTWEKTARKTAEVYRAALLAPRLAPLADRKLAQLWALGIARPPSN